MSNPQSKQAFIEAANEFQGILNLGIQRQREKAGIQPVQKSGKTINFNDLPD
jgi:hypothetical protein